MKDLVGDRFIQHLSWSTQAWIDQLAVGGRLVAPVSAGAGGIGMQALMVVDKTALGIRQTVLEAVNFVPLKSGIA